ncbi:hypothetical protein [Streptomyces europaeiscabiei]|uniref:hypothetical protein n=1 Tax=Streptomyces europaeiscabiei TaxID=146819 RepID=UPI0029C9B6E6|nr:hypothetical protein [Streptomyces europaeiscabiei]
MASNSRQFTADADLLRAGRHQLALNEWLSDCLDNPPAWTRDVTLGDLMRRTSGIAEGEGFSCSKAVDVPGTAKSYDEKDGSFTPHSSLWKQYGVGSVQTTPGELVRWADHHRTGRVGGTELLAGVTDGAVSVGDVLSPRGIEEGRYGAGILLLPDKSLVHRGDREGCHSAFKVSPDRNAAVTVVCNAEPPDNFRAANQLLDIWTT